MSQLIRSRFSTLSRRINFTNNKKGAFPHWSWALVLPAGMWGISTFYVQIMAPFLNTSQTWITTAAIAVCVFLSLQIHYLAHRAVAKLIGSEMRGRVFLFPFGDTAHAWAAAGSAWKEALGAVSGPLANLLLAGLTYLLWDAQWNVYLNISSSFISLFNVWLAVINLAPAYPLDGGRLIRVFLLKRDNQSATGDRAAAFLGYGLVLALTGWGIFLIIQHDRYSLETGLATILMALLYLAGLLSQKIPLRDAVLSANVAEKPAPIQIGACFLVSLLLTGISSTMLLTNNGVEAPGVALSVEPMVQIPTQYRHQPVGTFILTSVIQQSPAPVGAWYLAKLDPSISFLPPEKIIPHQTSAKESARQGFQMLDQSETAAVVVGLRQAGYPVDIVGKGVRVVSVLPNSPNVKQLLPGDVITAFDGKPVGMVNELISQVKTQNPSATVHLVVLRNQQSLDMIVMLMPPAQPGDSPKLGITVQDAGYDYQLPIPVKIVPQKIVGGPSAGLMFTLTVDNMLSPTDLTGGRKIAGTGTINLDGTVGPIGGVEQKVAAAEAAGAEAFLSPAENYLDALRVARKIQVVKIATVEDAIAFLKTLQPLKP